MLSPVMPNSENKSIPRRLARRVCSWGILALLCGTLAICPTVAQAGLFSISPNKEREIGEDVARQIEAQERLLSGPVEDWVNAIGQRLTVASNSEFQYSFHVVDSSQINAFALPGGHIYVYSGLRKVTQTDDELAAVLAHEITHAEEHHFARQYKKSSKRGIGLSIFSLAVGLPNVAQQALGVLDFAMTQKYSRGQESDADKLGMLRMARAGFEPQGMVSLLEKLASEGGKSDTLDKWFGDHPDSAKRVAAAKSQSAEIHKAQAAHAPLPNPQLEPEAAPEAR